MRNSVRDLWVTATSLTTGAQHGLPGRADRVVLDRDGVALLLTGIGFLVLTIAVLRPEETTEPRPEAA